MDDEKTLRVAFPIGASGDTLTLTEPTPAQRLTLSMLKLPEGASGETLHRMVQRLFLVLESVCVPGEWDKLNDGMASARYSVEEVLELVRDMAGFRWSEADPGPVATSPDVSVDRFGDPAYPEQPPGLILPKTITDPAPTAAAVTRPAPRVVGRA